MLALFILVQLGAAVADDSCSGGYQHGARVDKGRYWYQCQDGQLVPKGCLTEDLRRMDVGETYDDQDGIRVQCVIGRDGYLSFAYKSCARNGKEYQVNEQWEDQKNYYVCKKDREFVKIDVAGCIDKGGKKVAVNEKSVKGDFVYQCRKQSDLSFRVVQVGCYDNGRQYAIGDTFDKSNNLWYTCTTSSNAKDVRVISKCVGCIHDGQHLRDGDRVIRDDVIYACTVNGEDTKLVPVGCVTRENGVTSERRVNCSWVEGVEPFQYEVTCRGVPNSNTAIREQKKCIYTVPQGAWTMDPGCYRVTDKSAVGCLRDSNGQLQIRVLRMDDISNGETSRLGLRYC